jgi:hypothetical protein
MNSIHSTTPEGRQPGVNLLADVVGDGLHSIAQPLTVALWHLEVAGMRNAERRESDIAEAQIALGRVIDELEILRDIIRPFRAGVVSSAESMRDALVFSSEMQREALQNEGVRMIIREGGAQGRITAPQGFVQRILLCLFGILRNAAPVDVSFDISEPEHGALLVASLSHPEGTEIRGRKLQTVTTIRSYVEVLAGKFSIEADFSSIRIWLPKACSST